ncbi:MAG: hypothetical protein VYC40_01695 [Pseudomonadota bacterium]|nr:hypothetical protein [Pseudomonadota bacterium]
MKVSDLKIGGLYGMSRDPRIGYRFGATPLEEASRLALYVLDRKKKQDKINPVPSKMTEAWIYLGPKMVYGGRNGNQAVTEKVHHFVRPNGKRIYIYGEHIKHMKPFTQN